MASHLFDTKPSPELTLTYYQLNQYMELQTEVK